MAQSQWRRFQFFDKGWSGTASGKASRPLGQALQSLAASELDHDAPPLQVCPDACAYLPPQGGPSPGSSGSSSRGGRLTRAGLLFFGDDAGRVHVTDEDCNPLHVFSAFPGPVRFLKLTAGSASSGSGNSGSGSSEDSGPCLVALGSQDDGSTTLSSAGSSSSGGGGGGSSALWALKIWKLSSLLASLPPASTSAEAAPGPSPQRLIMLPSPPTSTASNSSLPRVTSLAASDNNQLVAVGYSSGGALLFRGNFASSSSASAAKLKPPLTLWPPLPFGDPPPPAAAAANANGGSSGSGHGNGHGGSPQGEGAAVTVPVVSLLFGERALSSALQNNGSSSSSGGGAGRSSGSTGGRGSSASSSRPSLPRLFVVTHLFGQGDYGTVSSFDVTNATTADNANALTLTVLDDAEGCEAPCMAHDPAEHLLIVGRENALYNFTCDDRAGAVCIEGKKQAIARLPGYAGLGAGPGCAVVASHSAKSGRTECAIFDVANKFAAFHHRCDPKQVVLTLLPGKGTVFVVMGPPPPSSSNAAAASAAPGGNSTSSVIEGGSSGSGGVWTPHLTLMKVTERDIGTKLDVLFKMNFYAHGILMAKAAGYSEPEINKMHLAFADHKYRKCDWEGAAESYARTIGFTEPSYVVRQFLDAQRIPNLAYYLEELHKADGGLHATKEHTTLLLHCYTKQKDAAKLAAFVSGEDGIFGGAAAQAAVAAAAAGVRSGGSGSGSSRGGASTSASGGSKGSSAGAYAFDVETAIDVLRASGQDKHALTLAKRIVHPKQHDWVLQLCLKMAQDSNSSSGNSGLKSASSRRNSTSNNRNSVVSSSGGGVATRSSSLMDEALLYLRSLELPVAAQLCCAYGRPLLAALPDQTTQLLIDLCTGTFHSTSSPGSSSSSSTTDGTTAAAAAAVADAEQYLPLFVDQSEQLQRFLAAVLTAALEADHASGGGNPTASASLMTSPKMMTSSSSSSSSATALMKPTVTMPPSAANTLLELLLRAWGDAAERAAHPYKHKRTGGAGGESSHAPSSSSRSSGASVGGSNSSLDPLSASTVHSTGKTSAPAAAADLAIEVDEAEVDPEVLAAAAAEASRCVMDLLKAPRTAAPYDRYHALVLTQVYRFKVGQHFLLERLSKASGGPALPGGATGAAATLAGSEGANNTSEALESAASLSGVVTDQLVEYYFATGQLEDLVRVCKRESHAEARPNPPLWSKVLTHLTLRCQLQPLLPSGTGKNGGLGAGAAGAAGAAADHLNSLGSTIGGGGSGSVYGGHSVSASYGGGSSSSKTAGGGGGAGPDGAAGIGSTGPEESDVALCADEDALEEAFDLLQDFLQDIENDQILPPLAVLQILALNPTLPLEVAQAYLGKHLKATVGAVEDLTHQTRSLKLKTEEMAQTIALDNNSNNSSATTTTAGSSSQSFSSSSFSSSSGSSSSSSSERGGRSTSGTNNNKSNSGESNSVGGVGDLSEAHKWEEMKRSMSKGAADSEARFAELERSRDGFATIAKFYGEGMIQ